MPIGACHPGAHGWFDVRPSCWRRASTRRRGERRTRSSGGPGRDRGASTHGTSQARQPRSPATVRLVQYRRRLISGPDSPHCRYISLNPAAPAVAGGASQGGRRSLCRPGCDAGPYCGRPARRGPRPQPHRCATARRRHQRPAARRTARRQCAVDDGRCAARRLRGGLHRLRGMGSRVPPEAALAAFPDADAILVDRVHDVVSFAVAAWCWAQPEGPQIVREAGEVHLAALHRSRLAQ